MIDTALSQSQKAAFPGVAFKDFGVGDDPHGAMVLGILRNALPKAKISYFGVMGPDGHCNGLDLFHAFQAVGPEVDGLNLSLAFNAEQAPRPLDYQLKRIAGQGTMIVAAAYNAGETPGYLFDHPDTIGVIDPAQARRLKITPDAGQVISPCTPVHLFSQTVQGTSFDVPKVLAKHLQAQVTRAS